MTPFLCFLGFFSKSNETGETMTGADLTWTLSWTCVCSHDLISSLFGFGFQDALGCGTLQVSKFTDDSSHTCTRAGGRMNE